MKKSWIQCAVAVMALSFGTSAMAMVYYGPTKSGDTAWSIAKSHRMSGVSTKQMAAAIQRLNPEVFNSHGSLQLGKTLEVPSTQKDLTAKPMGVSSAPTAKNTSASAAQKTKSVSKATSKTASKATASGTTQPSAADQSAAQSVSAANMKAVQKPPVANTSSTNSSTTTSSSSTATDENGDAQ